MKLDLTGLRIEVTDGIREYVEKKVEKLAKFFDEDTICHVTFTDVVKGKQHVDIRIEYKSRTYLAEMDTAELYTAMDDLVSKIEGQLRKDKSIMDKKRKEKIEHPEVEDVEALLDDEE